MEANQIIQTHHYFMLRGVGPEKTLAFVVSVETEKNDADTGYISTISDLEPGTLVAVGDTVEASEQAAVELFQEMADHGIEKGNLKPLLGDSEVMKEVAASVEKLLEAIESLENKTSRKASPVALPRQWLTGFTPSPSFA